MLRPQRPRASPAAAPPRRGLKALALALASAALVTVVSPGTAQEQAEGQEKADYHAWLVGWQQKLSPRQVQVSRMGVGERFPVHVDTDEEGLAVVYNFTRPWEERFGGVLFFPHPSGTWDELRVPPLFNSVLIFRSREAPHGVSPVLPEAGSHVRYTVTSFFLA